MKNEKLTFEEERALRRDRAEAAEERDLAIDVAVQATVNEAGARLEAREQNAEAVNAKVSAIHAAEREAAAKENAKEQHVEALSAKAETASMNTLRHVANARANREAQSADSSKFGLYFLITIILVAAVIVVGWLVMRGTGTNNAPAANSISIPGESGEAPVSPSVIPPAATPGPQGAAGQAGPAGAQGQAGQAGPAGTQGESGATGATGSAGPAGEAGAAAPAAAPSPSGQ